MSGTLALWAFAAIGVFSILRWTMLVQLKPAGEIIHRVITEPAMPYVPLQPGYKIRVLNPKDQLETVVVKQITMNAYSIPELLFFTGQDGVEGVCHASKASLVGVIPPPFGYVPGDYIQVLPMSKLLRVRFAIPHADPRLAAVYCEDRAGVPQTCLAEQAIPVQMRPHEERDRLFLELENQQT